MPRSPNKRPCAYPGCNTWARRDSDKCLCAAHAHTVAKGSTPASARAPATAGVPATTGAPPFPQPKGASNCDPPPCTMFEPQKSFPHGTWYNPNEVGPPTKLGPALPMCRHTVAAKVQAGLSYVTDLMNNLHERLPAIDQTPEELKILPKGQRDEILKERQVIVRALAKEVVVWHDGRIKIIGVLDGTEGKRFEFPVPSAGPRF